MNDALDGVRRAGGLASKLVGDRRSHSPEQGPRLVAVGSAHRRRCCRPHCCARTKPGLKHRPHCVYVWWWLVVEVMMRSTTTTARPIPAVAFSHWTGGCTRCSISRRSSTILSTGPDEDSCPCVRPCPPGSAPVSAHGNVECTYTLPVSLLRNGSPALTDALSDAARQSRKGVKEATAT